MRQPIALPVERRARRNAVAASSPPPHVRTKRIYEPPSHDDGYRVLIDGMWPRGVSREWAAVDRWASELAPSEELRRWWRDPVGSVRCL